jgi:hypothetical protein
MFHYKCIMENSPQGPAAERRRPIFLQDLELDARVRNSSIGDDLLGFEVCGL